ncbi:PepSY-associated TM helix domain-containing protein [Alteromonas sp. C1M14]|uniref:PepSY-associated TM helix domain-containing protein n=1 Tax=Alteromonas sp. C1M14 TaxID=2841567 RepID=UPI001C0837AF|nr:PepSY-associated TM helix domain-containing protein [Alteromonas sp. C1M14]MBU2978529.1 PepSY domain-containing protein [Alteromonas sp. C1M14]
MAKKRGLRTLYNLHAWVGFQLAIVMFVVLLTGTIATLSNEIDWLIFPELRASHKPDNASAHMQVDDWVGIYQSVVATYPDSPIVSMVKLDSEYLSFRVVIENDRLHNRFVQVDPWTYEVKGDIPRLTTQRFFRDFHRYLFMPAFPGLLIVGPLSLILLISIYTGIKTTRNWRKALWRVRLHQGKRVFISDLHKFLGLWGLWFTALMAITGAWYLYEFGNAVAGVRLEVANPTIESTSKDVTGILSVDEFRHIITESQNAHQNWEITAFYNSLSNRNAIQLRGVSYSNPVIRNRAHRVYIDPQSFRVIEKYSPATIPTQAYINEYADPLHFGDFGGFWLKMLWFIFGVALTAMSYTGVVMTWKRTRSSRLTFPQKLNVPVLILSSIAFIFWVQVYI